MKKAILILMLALSTSAFADSKGYASIEYSDETNRNTDAQNVKLGVVAGMKTADKWDYSLKMENSQAEFGNGSISTGVEARVRKGFTLGALTPYIGVRIGEKLSSSSNFSHYAADFGVKFPIAGNLSGDVGGRYRNAFDAVNTFQSTRGHVAVAYALTDKDSVAVRYSKSYGDTSEEKNSVRVSYTRSF